MALLSGEGPGAARPACCCPLPWQARYCSLGCSLRESKPGSTGRNSKSGSSRWPPSRCWQTPAVECCAPRSPASRPTGRGGGAAPKRGTIPLACRGAARPDLPVSAGHDADLRQPGVCPVLRPRAGRVDRQALARLRRQGRAATVPRRAVVVHARQIRRDTRKHEGRGGPELRWYLCHLYGFFDDAGKIVSFQSFATDISRERAEAAGGERGVDARSLLGSIEAPRLVQCLD